MKSFLGFLGELGKLAAVFSVVFFIFVVIPFGLARLVGWLGMMLLTG